LSRRESHETDMPPLRLYIETSAWSHYYADDMPERRDATREFFAQCEQQEEGVTLLIGRMVLEELEAAPGGRAARLLALVERYKGLALPESPEVEPLSAAYARLGALPPGKKADAYHAAMATIHEVDALVSWNYRHLLKLDRRRRINAVNMLLNYSRHLEIMTPSEVFADED
jgi:hypothetical protein